MSFDNHGIFAQGTYNFTDQLALTLGGRWTFDKIVGYSESSRYTLGTFPLVGTIPLQQVCNDVLNHPTDNPLADGQGVCNTKITQKTNKPTWLIGLDFKPTLDTLVYAKYARGYRQGAVNFTNPGSGKGRFLRNRRQADVPRPCPRLLQHRRFLQRLQRPADLRRARGQAGQWPCRWCGSDQRR